MNVLTAALISVVAFLVTDRIFAKIFTGSWTGTIRDLMDGGKE